MFMSFLCSILFLLVLGPSFAGAQEQTRKALEPSSSDTVRIYRSPEERREAGLGKQVTEWLKIGGVMDLEKEYRANRVRAGRNSNDDPDPELAVELGFEVQYGEWFEAEVLFAVE